MFKAACIVRQICSSAVGCAGTDPGGVDGAASYSP